MSKTISLHWAILAIIIFASSSLMLKASLGDSAIMDELAHIPAGYGYDKFLDARLNPEHPPLLKALSALPLTLMNLKFPTESNAWSKDINGQWDSGNLFIFKSGNNADAIINVARLAPILLTALLVIFIYIWSSELMGRVWAFLPTILFAFSPTVLAHGHYVTTDIAATFGFFIAFYYFLKFLGKPSQKHLVFAGVAFGLAELLKFSTVLLIPLFLAIMIIFFVLKDYHDWDLIPKAERLKKIIHRGFIYFRSVFVIFFIGSLVIYAAYFIFTLNYPIEKQLSDTKTILTSFGGGETNPGAICKPARCLADLDIWMAGNNVTRPFSEYLLGVMMVMQRSTGGNTAYFLGEVSSTGWWYYFPTLLALKEPLPSLILMLIALFLGLRKAAQSVLWSRVAGPLSIRLKAVGAFLLNHLTEVSMIFFIVFYWLYSMKSPLNIGLRHVLPTFPFIYILTAIALKGWISNLQIKDSPLLLSKIFSFLVSLFKSYIKLCIVVILVIWYLMETFATSPYFLSYFNEIGGGPFKGYQYAVDSNYDWGQDMKRFTEWVDQNNIPKIAVDYFGGADGKYYLGDKIEYWQSSKGNPADKGIHWFAISINNLQGDIGKLHSGQENIRKPEDEYHWLKNPYKPYAIVGTSIFIYKLE